MALILVVDDERSLREMVADAVAASGHEVIQAANGAIALQTMRTGRIPDLVLLDLTMPVMSGEQVLTALSADPMLCSVPVIVFTSNEVPDDSIQGKAVLHKPIELGQLLELVEVLCHSDLALVHALKEPPTSVMSYPNLGGRR